MATKLTLADLEKRRKRQQALLFLNTRPVVVIQVDGLDENGIKHTVKTLATTPVICFDSSTVAPELRCLCLNKSHAEEVEEKAREEGYTVKLSGTPLEWAGSEQLKRARPGRRVWRVPRLDLHGQDFNPDVILASCPDHMAMWNFVVATTDAGMAGFYLKGSPPPLPSNRPGATPVAADLPKQPASAASTSSPIAHLIAGRTSTSGKRAAPAPSASSNASPPPVEGSSALSHLPKRPRLPSASSPSAPASFAPHSPHRAFSPPLPSPSGPSPSAAVFPDSAGPSSSSAGSGPPFGQQQQQQQQPPSGPSSAVGGNGAPRPLRMGNITLPPEHFGPHAKIGWDEPYRGMVLWDEARTMDTPPLTMDDLTPFYNNGHRWSGVWPCGDEVWVERSGLLSTDEVRKFVGGCVPKNLVGLIQVVLARPSETATNGTDIDLIFESEQAFGKYRHRDNQNIAKTAYKGWGSFPARKDSPLLPFGRPRVPYIPPAGVR
ncbi:hypothetical protein JCM6882_001669 [Rhodosporidiobolus microsporus]